MVMRTALLIFTAAVLPGCQAAPQPRPVARYSKAGATNEMFQKDRFECIQASKIQVGNAFYGRDAGFAKSNVRVDRGTMASCLAARGYSMNADGEFGPPPGGAVWTVN